MRNVPFGWRLYVKSGRLEQILNLSVPIRTLSSFLELRPRRLREPESRVGVREMERRRRAVAHAEEAQQAHQDRHASAQIRDGHGVDPRRSPSEPVREALLRGQEEAEADGGLQVERRIRSLEPSSYDPHSSVPRGEPLNRRVFLHLFLLVLVLHMHRECRLESFPFECHGSCHTVPI